MNSEWECLAQARLGDESAWRRLVDGHQQRLLSLALLITGSVQAAEDIVQETFMRAIYAKITHYKGTVQGFLGTIAYRLSLKENIRLRRQENMDFVDITDKNNNSLEKVLHDERDRCIAEAIRNLDARHRDVLLLRFYAGHSYDEIAELLQISTGTVKSRIFHAVKFCREALRRKGF